MDTGAVKLSERTERRIKRLYGKIRKEKFPLCTEKARLVTEVYMQCEGEPEVTRCAKAYTHMLDNISIFIDEDELFVGAGASKPYGVEIDPFLGVWNEEDIRGAEEEGIITVEEKEWPLIRALGEYWKTKCAEYRRGKIYDDNIFKYMQIGITLPSMKAKEAFRGAYAGNGLCLSFNFISDWLNYEKWLKGLNPLITEIEEELKNLKCFKFEDVEKKLFLEASLIVLKAIITFANRYANLAERMASAETDPVRKKELLRIAEACRWVPANSPRNFFEAIQSFWFVQILNNPSSTLNLGRFDQLMYPYYKKDIQEGRITNEEVLALLCELRIKCMSPDNIKLLRAKRMQHAGFARWCNMTVGGVTSDGRDTTNELTFLVLEAALKVKTPHHTITVRVHEDTPEDLMIKALEVVKTGIGMPAFASDKSFIAYMTSNGVPIEEARNYHLAGCLDPAIPCKASFLAGMFFVAPKVLEIFLNGGVDPVTGLDVSPFKVDIEKCKTFGEFYGALKEYFRYFISVWHEINAITSYVSFSQMDYYSVVSMIETLLTDWGVKFGRPLGMFKTPAPYDFGSMMVPVGVINVVNSLAAIKKLVFEEKKITMKQLKEALAANWQGYAEIRKLCLKAPKYGNDDDYADEIAKDLYRLILDEESKYTFINGTKIRGVGGASITSMWAGGAITGATPDGRYAGETLADGTVSPQQGTDFEGPTAILKSALKIDQQSCSSTLLNMKIHPSALRTTEDLRKLATLIKTYFDNYGKWVQFNVVSKETLLEAQKQPEKYQELIVRVAGYSAYFDQLGKSVQDDVIRRTELAI